MLVLRPFEEEDFASLIAALPDPRSHVQWAGPEYAYPLDAPQLRETLARHDFKVYKAVLVGDGEGTADAVDEAGVAVAGAAAVAVGSPSEGAAATDPTPSEVTVGHVQLMEIDHERSTCVLGKVLVFPEWRGRGLGSLLVEAAVEEAFGALGLREMALLAFDFNEVALASYVGAGFVVSPPHPPPLPVEDENWQALRMVLAAERWREHRGGRAQAGDDSA